MRGQNPDWVAILAPDVGGDFAGRIGQLAGHARAGSTSGEAQTSHEDSLVAIGEAEGAVGGAEAPLGSRRSAVDQDLESPVGIGQGRLPAEGLEQDQAVGAETIWIETGPRAGVEDPGDTVEAQRGIAAGEEGIAAGVAAGGGGEVVGAAADVEGSAEDGLVVALDG